jgi:hypothetical protein
MTRAAVLLVLGLALAGCQTTGKVSDDRFIRFFDELAFGGGSDGARDKMETLLRWDGDWTWSVEGAPPFVDVVESHMSVFLGVAGLEGERVETGARVRIIQDPEDTAYAVRDDLARCKVRLRRSKDAVASAEIRIAVHDRMTVGHCIDHELMHGLGFRFHSGAVASVMSPLHGQRTLSRWDVMAIRALMSGDLEAGLTRTTTLDRVTMMLPRLRSYADIHAQAYPE